MRERPSEKTESVPRRAFISAMRAVASSVTVVTTAGPNGRHGATVSAFCSVSADPPAVLVCLKADSRTARLVTGNRVFCVNVLPDSRPEIADRFAGRDDAHLADRFDGLACAANCGRLPVIAGATAFACELKRCVDFGSHRIFIGQPVRLWVGACAPLAYLNGSYHRVVPHKFGVAVAQATP